MIEVKYHLDRGLEATGATARIFREYEGSWAHCDWNSLLAHGMRTEIGAANPSTPHLLFNSSLHGHLQL